MAMEEAFQKYLKMSQLTRGGNGRSDNNEAEETPCGEASMGRRIGSTSEHRPRRYARERVPAIHVPMCHWTRGADRADSTRRVVFVVRSQRASLKLASRLGNLPLPSAWVPLPLSPQPSSSNSAALEVITAIRKVIERVT